MQTLAAAAIESSAGSTTVPQPRLLKAAHEFEAQMMKELMKPMTQGATLTGAGDDQGEDSGSGGALGEFASEALAQALSAQGGIGMANRIVHDLSHAGNRNGTVPVTGILRADTVIKSSE